MVTLVRTGHIGLNAYLARRRVPGKTPKCSCGYRAQTAKHVVMFCPRHQERRQQLFNIAGSSDWKAIVQTKKGLGAIAK